MKRILVIGHTGQLGSALITKLREHDNSYVASGVNTKDIDIRDYDSIIENCKKHNPDVIINTAAYTNVYLSEVNPRLAYEINTFAIKNLAKICKIFNIGLMHISTDYVFGAIQMKVLTEDEEPNPLNNYGASKLCGEIILKNEMESSELPWHIIRTSNLYGLNSNKAKGTFISNMLSKLKMNQKVYLNNTNYISPTYAEDLSEYICCLIDKESGIYHAANYGVTTPFNFVQTAVEMINSTEYSLSNIVLDNTSVNINRPKFSFLGTNKPIGYDMPTWEDALKRFLQKTNIL